MKKSTKIALAALACLTVGVGAQVATAPQANAVSSSASDMFVYFPASKAKGSGVLGGTCHGDLVRSSSVNKGGNYSLRVYYSAENNGTLCSKMYNNTPYRHAMFLRVTNVDHWYTDFARDSGIFYKYAGPVKITNMKSGKCAFVNGAVYYQNGRVYDLFTVPLKLRAGKIVGC